MPITTTRDDIGGPQVTMNQNRKHGERNDTTRKPRGREKTRRRKDNKGKWEPSRTRKPTIQRKIRRNGASVNSLRKENRENHLLTNSA